MRIAHLADLHLGYRAHERQHANGINVREADVVAALRRAVDAVIEAGPDAVVIAGDLFHVARPSNAILLEAYQQVERLAGSALQVVVVGGNHDSPRDAAEGNALRLLAEIPFVHVVVDEPEIVQLKDLAVLAVPHGGSTGHEIERLMRSADLVAKTSGRARVLVVHAAIQSQDGVVSYGERLPLELFAPGRWDYVAAGDYHIRAQLGPRAWYSGSIEFTSSNIWEEARSGAGMGWLLADLATGEAAPQLVELNRGVFDLEPIDAQGMTGEELTDAVVAAARALPAGIEGQIVRQIAMNVDRGAKSGLERHARIVELKAEALHFNLDVRAGAARFLEGPAAAAVGANGTPTPGHEAQRLSALPLDQVVTGYVAERFDCPVDVSRDALGASAVRFLGEAAAAAEVAA